MLGVGQCGLELGPLVSRLGSQGRQTSGEDVLPPARHPEIWVLPTPSSGQALNGTKVERAWPAGAQQQTHLTCFAAATTFWASASALKYHIPAGSRGSGTPGPLPLYGVGLCRSGLLGVARNFLSGAPFLSAGLGGHQGWGAPGAGPGKEAPGIRGRVGVQGSC